MKKLTLQLDHLEVESFETVSPEQMRGTVRGHGDSTDCSYAVRDELCVRVWAVQRVRAYLPAADAGVQPDLWLPRHGRAAQLRPVHPLRPDLRPPLLTRPARDAVNVRPAAPGGGLRAGLSACRISFIACDAGGG